MNEDGFYLVCGIGVAAFCLLVRWVVSRPTAKNKKDDSFELLAAKVIPIPPNAEHKMIELLARGLVAAVMRKLWERGSARFDRLHYYMATAKSEELKLLLRDAPSQEVQDLFASGKGKLLQCVRAVATYHIETELAEKLAFSPAERSGLSAQAARLLDRFENNNGKGRAAK